MKFKDYLRLVRPVPDVKFKSRTICAEEQVQIEDVTDPPPSASNRYKYQWVVSHDDSTKIIFNALSQDFKRTINMPGPYSVRFIVESNKNCIDTLDTSFTVNGIVGEVAVSNADGCPSHTFDVEADIQLQIPSSPTSLVYDWDVTPRPKTHNIQDSTSKKAKISVTKAKCYQPSIVVTDNNSGCVRTLRGDQACIGVVAGFAVEPDSLAKVCLGKPLEVLNEATVNPVRYKWTSDNPNVEFYPNDSSNQISLIFRDNGTFNIKQKVWGPRKAGCKDSVIVKFNINTTKAKFKIDKPLSNCAPQQILFTNESVNSTKFRWIYGDGNRGIVNTTEHKYIYTQNSITGFTPKLIAYSQASPTACKDTFILSSKVRIIGPTAEFRMDTAQVCDTGSVEFYNFTSPLNATFKFDYGDGTTPSVNKMPPRKYVFNGGSKDDSVLFFPTIVATSFGCDAFFTDTIVVYRSPVPAFKLDTNRGCKPLTVNLFNESEFTDKIEWDFFNDGVIDSVDMDTVSWEIDKVGRYGVGLYTQRGACKASLLLDSLIGVSKAPLPFYTASDSSICDSQTISFSNKTIPSSADFIFDYGDGSTPDTNVIKPHLYKIPATHPDDSIIFYPSLLADSFGCNALFQDTIIVYRSPKVDFTIDSSVGCQPFDVVMLNATDKFNNVSWDLYNDGVYDDFDDTMALTLDTSGIFSVRLRADYIGGCFTELTRDSFVAVIDTPVAGFTMDITQGCDSLTVNFKNTTSPAFTDFLIDFGDGFVAGNQNDVSHTYRLPNGFPEDSLFYAPKIQGKRLLCLDDFSDSVLLYKSPVASMSIDTAFGCQPLTVTMVNTSTPVFKTAWDLFDDGTVEYLDTDTAIFTLDTVGSWDISLFTEYRGGCTSVVAFNDTITIYRTPKPDFSLDTMRGCDSFIVSFKSNNPLDSFHMDYGNGLRDTNALRDQMYRVPGALVDTFIYTTSYRLYNPVFEACTAEQQDTITVFSSPIAGFKADTLKGCAPLRIQFNDTTRKAISFEWDFNNDGIADDTISNPDTVFNHGKQTIGIIVGSAEGCSDTLYKSDYLTVFNPPRVSIGRTVTSSCADREVQFNDNSVLDTNIFNRLWSFGVPVTGDTLRVPRPKVSYPDTGTYKVSLTVTDSNFCKATDSTTINIINKIIPSTTDFLRLSLIPGSGNKVTRPVLRSISISSTPSSSARPEISAA